MFAAGALVEIIFSLLLDAISQPHKTLAMLRLVLGLRPGWLPQNRSARGVAWMEAARMFWPHTLFGMAVLALLARISPPPALWALPFAARPPLPLPPRLLSPHPALS